MANHAARTECPAVAELVRAIRAARPGITIGTIRGDCSRHTAGLAADIMLDSKVAEQKAFADRIIDALIDLQPQIKWHDIIYTDWVGDPPRASHFHIPGGGGGYGGTRLEKNPVNRELGQAHENHIHVDWVDFSLRIKDDCVFVYDWAPDARAAHFGGALQARLMPTPPDSTP